PAQRAGSDGDRGLFHQGSIWGAGVRPARLGGIVGRCAVRSLYRGDGARTAGGTATRSLDGVRPFSTPRDPRDARAAQRRVEAPICVAGPEGSFLPLRPARPLNGRYAASVLGTNGAALGVHTWWLVRGTRRGFAAR